MGRGRKRRAYSCSGGPDAVEHVGTQGYGYDEVFGISLCFPLDGRTEVETVGGYLDLPRP